MWRGGTLLLNLTVIISQHQFSSTEVVCIDDDWLSLQCHGGVQEAFDANQQQGSAERRRTLVWYWEVQKHRRQRRAVEEEERWNSSVDHAVNTSCTECVDNTSFSATISSVDFPARSFVNGSAIHERRAYWKSIALRYHFQFLLKAQNVTFVFFLSIS